MLQQCASGFPSFLRLTNIPLSVYLPFCLSIHHLSMGTWVVSISLPTVNYSGCMSICSNPCLQSFQVCIRKQNWILKEFYVYFLEELPYHLHSGCTFYIPTSQAKVFQFFLMLTNTDYCPFCDKNYPCTLFFISRFLFPAFLCVTQTFFIIPFLNIYLWCLECISLYSFINLCFRYEMV